MARGGAATAGGGEEAAADARPKRPTSRRLMIAGAAVLVAGVGAWQFLGRGGAPVDDGSATGAVALVAPASYYRLPEMVVNLAGTDRTAFVRLRVTLQYSAPGTAAAIERSMPRITDALLTYTRELRVSDLSGSAGVFRLRDAIRQRVNLIIHPAAIDDVLFEDILIQ